MAKTLREVYQLKIVLNGSKPPIWRRFLVDSTISLAQLHKIIQVVMGWDNCHLHQFVANGSFYGYLSDDIPEIEDENKYRLDHILKQEKMAFIYEYDFGDSWEHKITLEKISSFDTKLVLPQCIKAKGACPPEDVGGIWGYYEYLAVLNDPAHPDYEEYKEQIGDDFDPLAYDMTLTNKMLVKYCS